jgi:hypothetical protein
MLRKVVLSLRRRGELSSLEARNILQVLQEEELEENEPSPAESASKGEEKEKPKPPDNSDTGDELKKYPSK